MVILLNDIHLSPFKIEIDTVSSEVRRLPLSLTGLRAAPTYEFAIERIGGCRLNHNLAVLKHKIAGKVMLPVNLSVWLIKSADSVLL
jgi:hypothetical protein